MLGIVVFMIEDSLQLCIDKLEVWPSAVLEHHEQSSGEELAHGNKSETWSLPVTTASQSVVAIPGHKAQLKTCSFSAAVG